jgi:hypothetical protein
MAAVAILTTAAQCGSGPEQGCPLQIRRVYLSGRAPQVIVQNKASYPVGHVVIHAAYQDLLKNYQEPTQAFDTIIQPDQRLTLSMEPITGAGVDWESLNVFPTCQAASSTSSRRHT